MDKVVHTKNENMNAWSSEGFKEGFWIYMPDWLAKRIEKMKIDYGVKDKLNYKTKSGRTVSAKYIRKWFNNLLVKLRVDKDVRNFILGRRREIKFSVEADNYLELLQLADEEYKRICKEVSKLCQIDGTGWHRFDLLPALKGEDSLQGEPPTRRRYPYG